MRRVVVTGLGAVSPLAGNIDATWSRLLEGKSGLGKIEGFDVSDLPVRVAAQIPTTDVDPEGFDASKYMAEKEQRKVDPFIVFGVSAAQQAIEDSGWIPETEEQQNRSGVIIGSGIGGLSVIHDTSLLLDQKGPRRISPFFIPASLINLASGHVAIRHGFRGPNHAVVTACATGAHAIGDASRIIMFGDADVMLAGGAESAICRVGIGGFASARALSTSYNDSPTEASRPWDEGRDGFVMGEGSGVIMLEELEHAKRRGAKIYGEIIGYGMSGDAHHITAPAEDGNGFSRAMESALKNAKINREDIDYINAHGTSTPPGDKAECNAVKNTFKDHAYKLSMSSTKSAIGHLLGAAGSIEAIFALKAMNDNVAPPTLNLHNPSDGCDIDLVPLQAKERDINVVMSNSFGFGGTNASLIFRSYSH